MENINTEKILKDYFDAQQLNFINHLQRQEQNFQAHFQMLEDLFSNNSNNDTNQFQQKLNSHKIDLENNMKKENTNFQNKLKAQKRKTNNLLARTNIYIPDNNNNFQNRRNYRNSNRSPNRNSPKKEVDKNLEFKKLKLISALPCFQYRYIIKYEKRHEKNCSICLNDFKPDDILIRFSCKEHIFHKSCLLTWLEKSDICPLCKKSLFLNK